MYTRVSRVVWKRIASQKFNFKVSSRYVVYLLWMFLSIGPKSVKHERATMQLLWIRSSQKHSYFASAQRFFLGLTFHSRWVIENLIVWPHPMLLHNVLVFIFQKLHSVRKKLVAVAAIRYFLNCSVIHLFANERSLERNIFALYISETLGLFCWHISRTGFIDLTGALSLRTERGFFFQEFYDPSWWMDRYSFGGCGCEGRR